MTATGRPAMVIDETHRADGGTAAVLAIGTANPANFVHQDEFADWYFRVTKSDHLATLKAKMKRICEKSGIKKRHFHHTDEMIGRHPEFVDSALPSLGARMGITVEAVPVLAAAAAAKAIAEWGRPAADVTHLVVGTSSGAGAPGADLRLAALLGLPPTVRRTLLNLHGCSAGCVALRVAKDLGENNRGARVLVVCADVFLTGFRGPDEAHLDTLVANALFGDGAGAAIVGAGPRTPVERPIFHMVSASQTTLPGTEHAVTMQLGEHGLGYHISAEVPAIIRGSIEGCLAGTLAPHGLGAGAGGGWNGLFWAVHPGGRAILDSYEAALGLDPGKLAASRRVLGEFGNMLGATIIFVLDELRRRRRGGGEEEVEDCEWGVMSGLGPGLTVETMVLHSAGGQDED
ncbi:hypothetical protein ACP70R_007626 [Stipagrostis hirtigluma subsp. patula]